MEDLSGPQITSFFKLTPPGPEGEPSPRRRGRAHVSASGLGVHARGCRFHELPDTPRAPCAHRPERRSRPGRCVRCGRACGLFQGVRASGAPEQPRFEVRLRPPQAAHQAGLAGTSAAADVARPALSSGHVLAAALPSPAATKVAASLCRLLSGPPGSRG